MCPGRSNPTVVNQPQNMPIFAAGGRPWVRGVIAQWVDRLKVLALPYHHQAISDRIREVVYQIACTVLFEVAAFVGQS